MATTTPASLTRQEIEQRLDYLVAQMRAIHEYADRDSREVHLQYVFGEAWDELGPDDERWRAAEFLIAGHLYGKHPAVGVVQLAAVELVNGLEQAIAAESEDESWLEDPAGQIKRRAERLLEEVTAWVDSTEFQPRTSPLGPNPQPNCPAPDVVKPATAPAATERTDKPSPDDRRARFAELVAELEPLADFADTDGRDSMLRMVLRYTSAVPADDPRWNAAGWLLALDQTHADPEMPGPGFYAAGDDQHVRALHAAAIDAVALLEDATYLASTGETFNTKSRAQVATELAAATKWLASLTETWLESANLSDEG
jgi:hypothetical protein